MFLGKKLRLPGSHGKASEARIYMFCRRKVSLVADHDLTRLACCLLERKLSDIRYPISASYPIFERLLYPDVQPGSGYINRLSSGYPIASFLHAVVQLVRSTDASNDAPVQLAVATHRKISRDSLQARSHL